MAIGARRNIGTLLFILILIAFGQSQKIIQQTKVGDFYIGQSIDRWTDDTAVHAITIDRLTGKAMFSFTCGAGQTSPTIDVLIPFIPGAPSSASPPPTGRFPVSYRVGKSAPEDAWWYISLRTRDNTTLISPTSVLEQSERNNFVPLEELVGAEPPILLFSAYDEKGAFHTFEFSLSGIGQLRQYLPCMDPAIEKPR